jgi:hypothetical protein
MKEVIMFARIAWRVVFGVLTVVVLLAALSALGWMAYSAGLAQGAAQGGAQVVPQTTSPVSVPLAVYGMPGFYPFGVGLLGCLIPLAFIALVATATRMFFWHGFAGGDPEGRGFRGPFGRGGRRHAWREMAEEWHRQAHAGMAQGPTESANPKA